MPFGDNNLQFPKLIISFDSYKENVIILITWSFSIASEQYEKYSL